MPPVWWEMLVVQPAAKLHLKFKVCACVYMYMHVCMRLFLCNQLADIVCVYLDMCM